jgi:SapC
MDSATQSAAARSFSRPLPASFYKKPVLLRFDRHAQSGLKPCEGFGFASEVNAVPLGISEFAAAARHCPIVFSHHDVPVPLAVMGLRPGENLFVDPAGRWRPGHYQPACVRLYPFLAVGALAAGSSLLGIDAESSRFIEKVPGPDPAARLFSDNGETTPMTRSAMNSCLAFDADRDQAEALGRALADAGLLTADGAEAGLSADCKGSPDGFQVVDEKALLALPFETIAHWQDTGRLGLLSIHRASLANWQRLLDLHAARHLQTGG